MSTQTSKRAQQVQPSVTLAISAKAKAMKAEGKDVINMSVGEPDFDTPEKVKAAGIKAIKDGDTKYTAADGTPELKQAIIHKLKRDNTLDYEPDQIIASAGAKQGLYNLCQAVLNPGDEAIIPAPYWVSYPPMVELAGGKSIIINASIKQQFKITAAQLEKAITPKTRLFFLNSPSNPTGMIYNKAELKALGEVLKKHPHILIAADDIYEYIIWSSEGFTEILNACPELKDRTVVFNGCSKAFAMTGWRLGYAAGPPDVIKAMKKIQSHSTSNPCSISEAAATVAINCDPNEFSYMYDAFKKRHDIFYKAMSEMPLVDAHPADGTFYLFIDASKAIKHHGLKDDIELASFILDKALIACVPGSGFGSPGCLRFSYATSDKNILEAIKRLSKIFS